MFPNVRLMIAAMMASIVVMICGFGIFAAFHLSHDPFGRLPPSAAHLQLTADSAAAPALSFAPEEPIDRHFPLSFVPAGGGARIVARETGMVEQPPEQTSAPVPAVAPEKAAALEQAAAPEQAAASHQTGAMPTQSNRAEPEKTPVAQAAEPASAPPPEPAAEADSMPAAEPFPSHLELSAASSPPTADAPSAAAAEILPEPPTARSAPVAEIPADSSASAAPADERAATAAAATPADEPSTASASPPAPEIIAPATDAVAPSSIVTVATAEQGAPPATASQGTTQTQGIAELDPAGVEPIVNPPLPRERPNLAADAAERPAAKAKRARAARIRRSQFAANAPFASGGDLGFGYAQPHFQTAPLDQQIPQRMPLRRARPSGKSVGRQTTALGVGGPFVSAPSQ